MRAVYFGAVCVLLAGTARGEEPADDAMTVPGEVALGGGDDVAALCGELGDEERGEDARAAVYVMRMPPSAFHLSAYDGLRARVMIDATRGMRAKDLSWELVLWDLGGDVRRGTGVDMAVPATAGEAAAIAKAHKAGLLSLSVWFRVARPAAGADAAPVCATVHHVAGEGTRLAIEPLGFELRHGAERLASGEVAELAALREKQPEAVKARVVVAPPVVTRTNEKAPAAFAKAVAALEPKMAGCYQTALADDPDLRGSLVAGIAVDATGKVTEARAELDGLGVDSVVTCALGHLLAARLPRGQAGAFSVGMKFTASR